MNRLSINLTAGLIVGAGLASTGAASAADACSVRSGPTAVPLVELYTSEGCSSCPPADRWFSKHVGDSDTNFLAFHVDYWDSIGWPDRFGSPAYSERQRDRVNALGGSTVYTPQVMVGEQVNASWHSDSGFGRALRDARRPADVGLALNAQPQSQGLQVRVGAQRASGGSTAPAKLWLAQYSDGQTTQVRAGENSGVTLHHDRVVRHLWGPWPIGSDALVRNVDVSPLPGTWGLVAFAQDARGQTLQSLALPGQACVVN